MRILLTCLWLAVWGAIQPLCAQETLGIGQLLGWVRAYHPVARQAELIPLQANAALRQARGAFDPKLYGNLDSKWFEEKDYYTLLGAGLKVPTWWGAELKGGYEFSRGVFLNPETSLPEQGLLFAGLTVPLAQGFVIDERRAALRTAQVFREVSEVERRIQLNDLFFDAAQHYWAWNVSFEQLRIFRQAVAVARQRLNFVRSSYQLGEEPAVDTLEATILLQSRQLDLYHAELNYQNNSQYLSVFLWDENGRPLEITPALEPVALPLPTALPDVTADSLQMLLSRLDAMHPEMLTYRFKLAGLDIERRMKAEMLKPRIDLSYNLLNNNILTGGEPINSGMLTQNYKWGLELGFPLFLRKERGALEQTRLKIESTRLDQELKRQELSAKINSYYNELETLRAQSRLYESAVQNYRALLRAEEIKFQLGESSLFLLNTRESKLIEAELKLVEIWGKYNKSLAGLAWVSGLLWTQ